MSHKPTISDAEWKIMKLLWRKAPQPAYDLAEELAKSEKWSHRTVKTLLNRLLKKGAVSYQEYKNLYLYSPAVSEEECIRAESESFLERVFDGSLSMMMVHFARQKKLTKSEIEELKRIVEKWRANSLTNPRSEMSLEFYLETVVGWVWQSSWQASFLVLLVLLIQLVFAKRLTPSWRYGLWLLVLVRLVLPVTPASRVSVFNWVPSATLCDGGGGRPVIFAA